MPRAAGNSRSNARPSPAVAYLAALLLFAGHLALGADRTNIALGLAAVWFVFLAVLVASRPWARRALEQTPLALVAVPFVAVLVFATLSLTPFGPGGPSPIWRLAPGARAVASLDPYATLVEMVKLAALAAAFLVGAALGGEDERLRGALRAVVAAGAVYGAWAFLDHAVSPGLLYGAPRPFGPERLSASFGSGNTAATLFGALALLSLVWLARAYARARPAGAFHAGHLQRIAPAAALPVFSLAVSATCLMLTQSRGPRR